MKIEKNSKIKIIYHANCPDGLCGAAIVDYFLKLNNHKNIEFIKGFYSKEPPIIRNSTIFMVDFSYPLAIMQKFIERNNKIILLDHHKSAIEQLQPILNHPFVVDFCSHDNKKSGTTLAWSFFNGDTEPPVLFKYIEDRDLWKWVYPDSLAYLTRFDLEERTITSFQKLVKNAIEKNTEENEYFTYVSEGNLLLKQVEQFNNVILSDVRYLKILNYEKIPTVNCSSIFSSDIGNKLIEKNPNAPFSLCWILRKDFLKISLRSTDDRADVSIIAKEIFKNGGGHHNASGVSIPIEELKTNPVAISLLSS